MAAFVFPGERCLSFALSGWLPGGLPVKPATPGLCFAEFVFQAGESRIGK